MKKLILFLLSLNLFIGLNAKSIHYVKQGATGTGTSWADASGDIQAMINASMVGDEVWVATGTYYPTQAINDATDARDRTFVMREGVSLYGGFQGLETAIDQRQWADPSRINEIGYCEFKYSTILSGDLGNDDEWTYDASTKIWSVNYNRENSYKVVYYKPTTKNNYEIIFDGFTVKGGNNTAGGIGGIGFSAFSVRDETTNWETKYFSTGTIKHCTVVNNSCNGNGSGVYCAGTIQNCNINSNISTGQGGGLWLRGIAKKCSISKNNAGEGGGITIWASSLADSCNVFDNYAGLDGGGFYMVWDSKIQYSDIHDNLCTRYGAGGYMDNNGSPKAYKCRIYSNKNISGSGGGCFMYGGNMDACLIFNNSAGMGGGGIDNHAQSYFTTNCIIFNNSAPSGGAMSSYDLPILSGENNIIYNNSKWNYWKSWDTFTFTGLPQNSIIGSVDGGVYEVGDGIKHSFLPNSVLISGKDTANVLLSDVKFVRPSTFEGLATTPEQLQELMNTDWHIQEGSVLIDRGTLTNAPAADMDGNPRPLGTAVDVGPYEFFKYDNLPFTENFETGTMKFFTTSGWVVKMINNSYQAYYAGVQGVTNYNHDFYTNYFKSPSGRKVSLSYDVTLKSANKTTIEQLAVVLLPMGASKGDTIAVHNNQSGSFTSLHFSFNHYLPVGTQYFQLKFIAKGANAYNVYYWNVDNVNLVENTKPDYTIVAVANQITYGIVSGAGIFDVGSNCSLTATPNTGYTFTNWTENGVVVSTSANYTFTVSGNRTLVANFTPNYTVFVSANPTAGGAVTGGGSFTYGASQTVTATPNAGYIFTNWTENGTIVSTSASYTFTVIGNRTLLANFTPINYTVSVSAYPTTGGEVAGGGSFAYGTSQAITATPNAGYIFTNWTENGTVVSTSASYTFTISGSRAIMANFTVDNTKYTVYAQANTSPAGVVAGSGTFVSGTSVTVTASPNTGYIFSNWTENGTVVSTSASYTFLITKNRTLIANFIVANYAVTISVNPPEYLYLSYATVSGAGNFDHGSKVSVSAMVTPVNTADFVFKYWTEDGQIVSTEPNYSFTISRNYNLVANFTELFYSYGISALVNPANSGTVWGVSRYNSGELCTLKATANTGYIFTNWTEDGTIVSTSPIYTFTVSANKTLIANFKLNTGIPDVSVEKINVYSSNMSVYIENGEGWVITLIDATGKKVFINKITSYKFKIPVNHIGVYAVLLTKDNKTCSHKIIVNK